MTTGAGRSALPGLLPHPNRVSKSPTCHRAPYPHAHEVYNKYQSHAGPQGHAVVHPGPPRSAATCRNELPPDRQHRWDHCARDFTFGFPDLSCRGFAKKITFAAPLCGAHLKCQCLRPCLCVGQQFGTGKSPRGCTSAAVQPCICFYLQLCVRPAAPPCRTRGVCTMPFDSGVFSKSCHFGSAGKVHRRQDCL